ncbi:MAG: FAD:protein FMN transferase [Gammaproteobacteria bacterium]|nr:FAD:protein FMN transferase [Gammaproteobacteria bacterium]
MKVHSVFSILAVFLLLVISSDINAEWLKKKKPIMGTEITVEIWHEEKQKALECISDVFKEMWRIDALMSPYKSDSELTKINNMAQDNAVVISSELFQLLEKSLNISKISNGAFDITFSSIGYLYDYREGVQPLDKIINEKLEAVDYRHILLNKEKSSVRFKKHGVRIDLGGIAKGYAVDNAIAILKGCGTEYGLVTAGGDSRILGDKKGRPWMMGIQHPRKKKEVAVVLPLSNTAISTSGDYERYFIKDDRRIHHIINPQTGKSADKSWSASVIADNALTSDALSTTLFVLGAKKGLALINRLEGVDAVIIDSKGTMHYSSGLLPPEKQSMN